MQRGKISNRPKRTKGRNSKTVLLPALCVFALLQEQSPSKFHMPGGTQNAFSQRWRTSSQRTADTFKNKNDNPTLFSAKQGAPP